MRGWRSGGATIPAGSCPTVGVGGLALGGGVGFASRKLGTTADNVLSRPDRDRRRAATHVRSNEARRSVLGLPRWRRRQLRGRHELPLPYPPGDAGVVLRADLAVGVDERRRRGVAAICSASSRTASSRSARLATGATQPSVQAFGQFFGSEAKLRQLLAPLRAIPGGSLTTGTSPYFELMERWAGCKTLGFDECHLAAKGLSAASALRRQVGLLRQAAAGGRHIDPPHADRAAARATGAVAAILDSYGGAINRVAPGATAFVHRRALFSIQYYAAVANAAGDAAALAWLRGFRAAMQPHASGTPTRTTSTADLAELGARVLRLELPAPAPRQGASTTPTTSSASARAFVPNAEGYAGPRPYPGSGPPSTSGPGHSPFKAVARVRIPLGA